MRPAYPATDEWGPATGPSAIVNAFVAGLPGDTAPSPRSRALTELLDAFHERYAAEVQRVLPRPDAPSSGTLPLPVGLPSSQILANLVVAVALRDLEALPGVAGVSAYADDVLVVSRELPDVNEDPLQYFTRIDVVEARATRGQHR